MAKRNSPRNNYENKIKELIKVLEYRMQFKMGYIELHDYTDVYGLNKTQLLKILEPDKLLKRILKYNKDFEPAT